MDYGKIKLEGNVSHGFIPQFEETENNLNKNINVGEVGESKNNKNSFDSSIQKGIISLRSIARPPHGQNIGKLLNEIQKYILQTGIEKTFISKVQLLLNNSFLPYNPYPGFVKRIREFSEKMLIKKVSPEAIFSLTAMPAEGTRIDYIYKALHEDNVWGLPTMVRSVAPLVFKQYVWLANDMLPPALTLKQADPRYTIQPVLSLIGSAVFHGSLYQYVPMIQFKLEYFIVGPNLEDSVEIFVNSVIKDFNHVERKTKHVLLGVTLPLDPTTPPLKWTPRFWQVDEINTRGQQFFDSMVAATKNKKPIIAEICLRVDADMGFYKRGQKHYTYNFVKRADTTQEREELYCFSELPESALYEGVFTLRHHAEAYISMFTPRVELIDRDKLHRQPQPAPLVKLSVLQKGKIVEKHDDDSRQNRVDGFLFRQAIEYAPDAVQIVKPIKEAWMRKIARCHPVLEIFEAIHYLLLLVLMDRQAYPPDIIVEIHRMLHSTSAKMHEIMQINKFIRELIENFEKARTSEIVQHQYNVYKKGIDNLLNNELRGCTSDMMVCARVLAHRFDEMCFTTADGSRSSQVKQSNLILNPKTVLDLRFMNHYCVPIFLQLVEDVIVECPIIKNTITNYQKEFPDESPLQPNLNRPIVRHGFEDERIANQDRQVLQIDKLVQQQIGPEEIATESVITQYMLDIHLDEIWTRFLQDIFLNKTFPANPYSLLITTLRQASQKMSLFFDENSVVCKRLYHSTTKLIDPVQFVYQIPGVDAFGYKTALSAIDTAAFFGLAPFMMSLANVAFTKRYGAYRAAVCMAIGGDVPFFGRLDPYLRKVDLIDHIYIKGPSKCTSEGFQLFSKVLLEHILELRQRPQSNLIIVGVYLGGLECLWTLDQVFGQPNTFSTEVEDTILRRQNIFLKVYAKHDWRYLLVVKHFLYRYVSLEEKNYDAFFEEDPTQMYFNIFLSQEKASFHSQRGGGHVCCDPFSGPALRSANEFADAKIVEAHKAQDWLQIHRWFLKKALMKQGERHLTESWRMLHSVGATFNYLNAINKVLQDLIFYLLERRDFKREDRSILANIQKDAAGPVEVSTKRTRKSKKELKDEEEAAKTRELQRQALEARRMGSINLQLLESTLVGYYYKLSETLSQRSALTANSLASVARRKLNHLMETEPIRNRLVLRVESGTIRALEEIRQCCMALEHALAYDVHCVCPEACEDLAVILQEASVSRPHMMENDPDINDVQRPLLTVADRADQWHFDLYRI